MTTLLYRPVLIESAEQAEALPRGTVALTSLNGEQASAGKIGDDLWMVAGDWPDYSNEDAVGWTALVPIEAEEERARSQINITHLPPPAPQMVPVRLPCPRCGLR